MLGRDLVISALEAYGVEYIFGNPGTTELPLVDALSNHKTIKYVLSLHEDISVGMAAGYAQATGKAGVLNLHVTPGLAHGLGNIYNAFRSQVPLIVTAGQYDNRIGLQEPALWSELTTFVKPFTKWAWTVHQVEELPLALHRAFKVALTEPRGPVFLALPSTVLMQDTNLSPIPLTHVHQETTPSIEVLQAVSDKLMNAISPVIIVGDRVGRSNAVQEVIELAHKWGIKVYGEHPSSGFSFPYSDPYFFGRCLPSGPYLQDIFAEVDLVILIGATIQPALNLFPRLLTNDSSQVIHIDCDEWEIGKNINVDLAIHAGIKSTLSALNSLLDTIITSHHRSSEVRQQILQRQASIEMEQEQRQRQLRSQIDLSLKQKSLTPLQVILEIERQLKGLETIIVDESVTSGKFVHNFLAVERENSFISLKGGGLGYGMPAALGAQLGRPSERVIAIIGDGSSLYYIQSLWNASKYNLPVIFIVINNRSYMIVKSALAKMDGLSVKNNIYLGADIIEPEIDFVKCANAFGIKAFRVDSVSELNNALEHCLNVPESFLIDCVVDNAINPYF
ncbi:thiamine pyrophosphate-binding protein [Alicyclobacillus sendaiensis]|uniref:thiamine pyrophosphate-binding protein n=1 Tax=Alicyclobacillus sendaiensis TaxID=192387 RepID=UPI0026F44B19|nr:thiamine pyrophosphate-binding protein [Alicyclobacillus sendaiensis]